MVVGGQQMYVSLNLDLSHKSGSDWPFHLHNSPNRIVAFLKAGRECMVAVDSWSMECVSDIISIIHLVQYYNSGKCPDYAGRDISNSADNVDPYSQWPRKSFRS